MFGSWLWLKLLQWRWVWAIPRLWNYKNKLSLGTRLSFFTPINSECSLPLATWVRVTEGLFHGCHVWTLRWISMDSFLTASQTQGVKTDSILFYPILWFDKLGLNHSVLYYLLYLPTYSSIDIIPVRWTFSSIPKGTTWSSVLENIIKNLSMTYQSMSAHYNWHPPPNWLQPEQRHTQECQKAENFSLSKSWMKKWTQ